MAEEIIELLLKYRVDPKGMDWGGRILLDTAIKQGTITSELAELLHNERVCSLHMAEMPTYTENSPLRLCSPRQRVTPYQTSQACLLEINRRSLAGVKCDSNHRISALIKWRVS